MPARPPGTLLVAAIDVEWSKNYRIRGGNVPFCYSVVWLAFAGTVASTTADSARFWYTSAYVQTHPRSRTWSTARTPRSRHVAAMPA